MPPRRRTPKVRRADEMTELHRRLLGEIQRAMVKREITNRELRAAGAPTQQAINKWQHGASPKLESLEALAAAFGSKLLVAIPGVSETADVPADSTTEASPVAAGPTPSKQAAYLMSELDAIRDEGARQQALVRCLTALSEGAEARPKKKPPRPKQAQPRGSTRVRWTAGGGAR